MAVATIQTNVSHILDGAQSYANKYMTTSLQITLVVISYLKAFDSL